MTHQSLLPDEDKSYEGRTWRKIIKRNGNDGNARELKKWINISSSVWLVAVTSLDNSSSHFFNSYAFPSHLFLSVTFCVFHIKTSSKISKITSKLLTSAWKLGFSLFIEPTYSVQPFSEWLTAWPFKDSGLSDWTLVQLLGSYRWLTQNWKVQKIISLHQSEMYRLAVLTRFLSSL